MRPKTARAARLLASAAVAAVLTMAVAGCASKSSDDITGSIGAGNAPRSDTEWRASLEVWGARYREKPNDADVAMGYARALRATDQRAPAVAVLEQAAIRNPHNMPLLGAYGRALAEAGDYNQALAAARGGPQQDNPDWSRLHAQAGA